MITLLEYLVVAAVIGAIVFFLAVAVFGRGEQIAPLDPRTAPAELPESGVSAADVRAVRFSMAVRGYRMSDVDWTLDRIGEELDDLRRENAQLRVLAADADNGPVTAPLGDVVLPLATDVGMGAAPDRGSTMVAAPSHGPFQTGDDEGRFGRFRPADGGRLGGAEPAADAEPAAGAEPDAGGAPSADEAPSTGETAPTGEAPTTGHIPPNSEEWGHHSGPAREQAADGHDRGGEGSARPGDPPVESPQP